MKNGITADFLKRYLIAKDQFWWNASLSPWVLNLIHEWAPVAEDPLTHVKLEPYKVSYWRDRVMGLCEYEITHTNFGMGYQELMNLDVPTFEEIEERVHKLAEERTKNMKELSETPQSNLLKDTKR